MRIKTSRLCYHSFLMARILVIEDDAELVQVISLTLYKFGYDVHYAFNGKEGHEKILSLRPDLVLLDLMLPIMPGTDVLKRVADNVLLRDIPIIVMTAYSDQANMLERSLRAQGAREYLRKPFSPKELLGLIRRTLEQYPSAQAPPEQVIKGMVRLDQRFRTVWIGEKQAATLSPVRTKLLRLLLESKGPVKRAKLLQAVWGARGTENLLVKTIQRLREDLGTEEARRIQTSSDGYELIG